jgi:hypothetical protein
VHPLLFDQNHFLPGILKLITENTLFSGAALSVRMLESINVIDLNSVSFDANYNLVSGPKKNASPGPISPSHFSMNLEFPEIDPISMETFYHWISETNSQELDRYTDASFLPIFSSFTLHLH